MASIDMNNRQLKLDNIINKITEGHLLKMEALRAANDPTGASQEPVERHDLGSEIAKTVVKQAKNGMKELHTQAAVNKQSMADGAEAGAELCKTKPAPVGPRVKE